jgi:hypothetical protein
MILDDLAILRPNFSAPELNLYIRKCTQAISNHMNVPVVITPDIDLQIPEVNGVVTTNPDEATTVTTDDGTNTTVQSTNIADTYPDALLEFVIICCNKKGNEGISQFSTGSNSGTYGNTLPDSVVELLPPPYATMLDVSQIPMGIVLL